MDGYELFGDLTQEIYKIDTTINTYRSKIKELEAKIDALDEVRDELKDIILTQSKYIPGHYKPNSDEVSLEK